MSVPDDPFDGLPLNADSSWPLAVLVLIVTALVLLPGVLR